MKVQLLNNVERIVAKGKQMLIMCKKMSVAEMSESDCLRERVNTQIKQIKIMLTIQTTCTR